MTTRREREALKQEIQVRDLHTRRIGNWFRISFAFGGICCLLAWCGFSGQFVNLVKLSPLRTALSWILAVIGVLLVIFGLLCFLSFQNSKKVILQKIGQLNIPEKGAKK
ncbi:MAG: hypothetical protein LBR25_08610 [Erysipelotrichaceae bacterium]|jgi:type VI protein secretion system component VasK|nr:hypothetical protein [Erysipelotrichaceae bacterium]